MSLKMFLYFSEFAFVGGVFVSEIVVERIVIVVRILAGSKNVQVFFSGNFLNGFKSTKCRVIFLLRQQIQNTECVCVCPGFSKKEKIILV